MSTEGRIQRFRDAMINELIHFEPPPDDVLSPIYEPGFWDEDEVTVVFKPPTLYRRPELGESVMVMRAEKMPTLVGKVGRIVERPAVYRGPYHTPDERVTAHYQTCVVMLEDNEDFEYMFRVGWLLYEDMELPQKGRDDAHKTSDV